MKTTLLRFMLPLVAIASLLGCGGVTMTDLQALNPQAVTLKVPCHPWQILENVKIFAVRPSTGDIVTDETPRDLRDFAEFAGAFIEVNGSAPPKNVAIMASEYGLICSKDLVVRSTPLESLRQREPCSTEVAGQDGRVSPQMLAEPGKPDCNPPKQAKKIQALVRVCTHPPGISGVSQWASRDVQGNLLTNNEKVFADAIAKADILFILDNNAPPESIYWFVKDPALMRCPNKPPPQPYAEAKASGRLEMMAAVASLGAELSGNAQPGNGQTTPSSTSASASPNGNGKTTSTSSPDGEGPPLDPFETIARELIFAGKLATTDTSAPATTADGSRHGMPGGKNVGGFSFPLLQAGVGLASIAIGVGMKPQDFIKKVVEKTGLGKPAIVRELNADALRLADELVRDYGEYVMAESIRKQGLILPFGMAQKFTANLGGKFQAHKIFERRAIEHFMKKQNPALSKEALKKAVDEVAKTYPAIILSEARHKEITKALKDAWDLNPPVSKADLRKIYKEVYQLEPHWLEAIESYLR